MLIVWKIIENGNPPHKLHFFGSGVSVHPFTGDVKSLQLNCEVKRGNYCHNNGDLYLVFLLILSIRKKVKQYTHVWCALVVSLSFILYSTSEPYSAMKQLMASDENVKYFRKALKLL